VGFARTLAAVVEAIGPAHGLIAHSMGGLGTLLALEAGLPAARVALVAPASSPFEAGRRFAEALGLGAASLGHMRAAVARRIGVPWEEVDPAAGAARVRAPILVHHDRDDPEVPWAEGAAIAGAFAGARLVTTTGLGHRRILRDAGVVASVVDFVAAGAGETPEVPPGACATPGCGRRASEVGPDGERVCLACAVERDLCARDAR
jgi:hypothetical protein